MAVDDLGDDVGKVGLRIDGIEFAAFDQRRDNGPMLSATIGAGEERIFPSQCNWSDAALDDIGIDLDPPVVEELASGGDRLPESSHFADCEGIVGVMRVGSVHKAGYGHKCGGAAASPLVA